MRSDSPDNSCDVAQHGAAGVGLCTCLRVRLVVRWAVPNLGRGWVLR